MNDRMYELINQAFIGTHDGKLSELNTVTNIEKFAELIIQDCVELCGAIASVHAGYHDVEGEAVAYSCSDSIKEHFGVE